MVRVVGKEGSFGAGGRGAGRGGGGEAAAWMALER